VDFDDDAKLDTGQIQDRRGQSAGGGGGGGGINPGAVAAGGMAYKLAGGGITGLVVMGVVVLLMSGVLGGGGSGQTAVDTGQGTGTSQGGDLASRCQTGADADQSSECRIVAAVNSVQAYWAGALDGGQTPYRKADTVFFSDRVSTACGAATSAVGPFYCPADETVYLDLGFFDELRSQFGAQGGAFAETYVIAHEYGHHVQHITGYDTLVGKDRQGPESGAVRLELQADCFAGVWARNAVRTGFVESITRADIEDGLDAASVIGDDRIQQRTQGRVIPEAFTHGTSAQRQRWLETGYTTGDPNRCNTFKASSL
jgi:predicted metalloprotease